MILSNGIAGSINLPVHVFHMQSCRSCYGLSVSQNCPVLPVRMYTSDIRCKQALSFFCPEICKLFCSSVICKLLVAGSWLDSLECACLNLAVAAVVERCLHMCCPFLEKLRHSSGQIY
jgi:hypothetical protein